MYFAACTPREYVGSIQRIFAAWSVFFFNNCRLSLFPSDKFLPNPGYIISLRVVSSFQITDIPHNYFPPSGSFETKREGYGLVRNQLVNPQGYYEELSFGKGSLDYVRCRFYNLLGTENPCLHHSFLSLPSMTTAPPTQTLGPWSHSL